MAFIMKIGNTDISTYIKENGFKWQKNDIDASNSGRAKDGTMRRKRITSKAKISVTCKPLGQNELVALLGLVSPETVSVTYMNPETAMNRTATFYSSSIDAAVVQDIGSEVRFDGISFHLIEV